MFSLLRTSQTTKQTFLPTKHSLVCAYNQFSFNAGKRNNTTTGQLQKKQAKVTNPRDFGSPKKRKPFTVIRDAVSATPVHLKNTPEKQNMTPSTTLSAGNTPTKLKSDEKVSTPKSFTQVIHPSPVKVSPSTLPRSASPYTPVSVRFEEVATDGNIEYSFEEIRAGYVLPQRTFKSALQFQEA